MRASENAYDLIHPILGTPHQKGLNREGKLDVIVDLTEQQYQTPCCFAHGDSGI